MLVEEAEAPFELLPLVVAGAEMPVAEVDLKAHSLSKEFGRRKL